jgi:short-subunit dehydrogenase
MTISGMSMLQTKPSETVLVLGATSSLAQAICRTLAQQGYGLLLAGRDHDELRLLADDLCVRFECYATCLTFDFMDASFSAPHFIENAPAFSSTIVATGDMGGTDPEDSTNLAMAAHVNYVLPAQLATAAAQRLSTQEGGGSVVIISSVAGDRGRQSNYAYGAAKAALSTFASGLRNRFYARGVHVMTVKPGFVDTPMTWGMNSPLIATRNAVALRIISAMRAKKDVVYVPFFWRFIMLVICHIPEALFKRMKL